MFFKDVRSHLLYSLTQFNDQKEGRCKHRSIIRKNRNTLRKIDKIRNTRVRWSKTIIMRYVFYNSLKILYNIKLYYKPYSLQACNHPRGEFIGE